MVVYERYGRKCAKSGDCNADIVQYMHSFLGPCSTTTKMRVRNERRRYGLIGSIEMVDALDVQSLLRVSKLLKWNES